MENSLSHYRGWNGRRVGLALSIFLIAFIIVTLLSGDRLPLIDRDEGWYAQISRTMQQSGDWVVPRFRGVVFAGKPVFAFWCQAVSIEVFGASPLAARLPSIFCAIVTLCCLGWAASKSLGPGRAFWSVFILGSSALFIGLSTLIAVDAELLLWIVIGEISLAAIYLGAHRFWIALLLWFCIGMGLMTKGPVVVGVIAGTTAALVVMDVGRGVFRISAWGRALGRWKWTRPYLAFIVLPALVLPWAILVHSRSAGFLDETVWTGMIRPIFVKPLESRATLHGVYLLLIWPCYLPWSLLLPAALMNGWKHRKIGAIRFCLAAVIGPYLVIECVQQKMVHYMLPLLPALALLTADFVDRALRNPKLIRPRGWKLGLAAWGLSLLLAAAALCVLAARFASLPRFAVAALALTVIAVVGTVVLLFLARRDGAALVAMGAGTLLAAIVLLAVLLPAFAPLNGLRLASGAMRANGLRPADAVGLVGYSEPSITFYLDGQGQDIGPNFLLTHPTAQWPRWIVISSGCWADLPQTQKNKLSVIGQYQVISSGSKRGNGTIVVARVRAGTDGLASIDAGQSSIASARPK